MGHLDQTRKNQRSNQNTKDEITYKKYVPTKPDPIHRANTASPHLIFADIEKTWRVYTDQTYRFPITPNKRNKLSCLIYHYDSNSILSEPLNNCTGQEILRSYSILHRYLAKREFNPTVTGCKMKHVKTSNDLTEKTGRLPIDTDIHAQKKCGWKGYQDMEKSLCIGSQWEWKDIPNAPMGKTPKSSVNHA